MPGAAFREVYVKVVLSIWLVVAALLLMQGGMNLLKFRALAAQASAAQMQVVGSTIEASIRRWEQLGLSMSEMAGLRDLLLREVARSPVVEQVAILDPAGRVIHSTGAAALVDADRTAVLRRVLGAGERESLLERGGRIYAGRILNGSSGSAIGMLVLSAPDALYRPAAAALGESLARAYGMLFLIVAGAALPLIVYQFRGMSALYRLLAGVQAGQTETGRPMPSEVRHLAEQLRAGDAVVARAGAELDQLAASAPEARA